MEFRQKFIEKILVSIVALVFVFVSKANNIVVEDVRILASGVIMVRVYPPSEPYKELVFSLNTKIPNYYLRTNPMLRVEALKIKHIDQELKTLDLTNVLIKEPFEYLEYKIYPNDIHSNSFLAVSSYLSMDYGLINFSSFLGGFSSLSEYNIDLNILFNEELVFQKEASFEILSQENICISCESLSFKNSNYDIKIQLNKNNIITKTDLQSIVQESISAIEKITNFEFSAQKNMTFIFDGISKNAGAISHENAIVFHFNEFDKYIIQKTIIHELYHWLLPHEYSWLNESAAEYLALKTMLISKLISDNEFLKRMSSKIKSAERQKRFSLKYIFKSPLNYNALYTKGAVYAWLLDMVLLENSDNKVSLEKFLFKDKSLLEYEISDAQTKRLSFEYDYISQNGKINFNQFLTRLGLLYEENKLKEIKPKYNIILEQIGGVIYIKDKASVGCLKNNDILVSVDGKKDLKSIYEKLASISKKSSSFVVLRKGVKEKYSIDNGSSIMLVLPFHLSFVEKISTKQETNWEQYKLAKTN